VIELCISAAKIAKIPVSTKYFEVNFEVSNNIFFQVIESNSMKALFNGSVTQKTIKEWERWIDEKMKSKE